MGNKNKQNYEPSTKISFKGGTWFLGIIGFIIFAIFSATEDYSQGERIGFVTKFSHKGRYWKSWEGELNLTQTGMNTSSTFDFSIDNDKESPYVVGMIDSSMNKGWKIKLKYHEVYMKNWFSNRGETDFFIDDIVILDRHSMGTNMNIQGPIHGRVVDTIFVVIDKSELLKKGIKK